MSVCPYIISIEEYKDLVITGTNDWTAAVQKAVDDAPEFSEIIFRGGAEYFVKTVESKKSLRINLNGAKLKVQPWLTIGGNPKVILTGAPVFWFRGELGGIYKVNASIVGSTSITLSNEADAVYFEVGNYIQINDNRVVPPWDNGARGDSIGYQGRGELNLITEINGADLGLAIPLEWSYDTTPTITKINKMLQAPEIVGGAEINEVNPGVPWNGELTGACPHIFHFEYALSPLVEKNNFRGWTLHTSNFHYCLNPKVSDSSGMDPFRPQVGGHGYFTRFDHCRGGIVEKSFGKKIRHMVDYTQTYDGTSAFNIVILGYDVSFYMHGLGAKRCSSLNDTVLGSNTGWATGNPIFEADYGFDIIRPNYTGTGYAIVHQTKSEEMSVTAPNIKSTNKCFLFSSGASRLKIIGGTSHIPSNSEPFPHILNARSKVALTDPMGFNPRDLTIRNHEGKGKVTIYIENMTGSLVINDNKLDTNDAVGEAVVITSTATAIEELELEGNIIQGSMARGMYINAAPSKKFRIGRNYIEGSSVVAYDIRVISGLLEFFNNESADKQSYFFSDLSACKEAGATLFGNRPATIDDVPIKSRLVETNEVKVVAPAGSSIPFSLYRGTLEGSSSLRWLLRGSADAESGFNTGTDFEIVGRNDAGANLGTYFKIVRKTGDVLATNGKFFVAGTWQKPFVMGGSYLWVDGKGKLRIKTNAVPSSDTDGFVVGAQL